ncbi:MAG: hypothetical protein K0S65_1469 [Labilithrix sp.]|nr:hypothetical protein [Labilithrix sp.]
MTNEPKRLVDEDPGFARLVAASEDDGPSPAEIDEAVVLARRMVSASRWRTWRWLGSGTAIVGASVLGFFAVTSTSSGNSAPKPAEVVTPFVESAAPTNTPLMAPAPERAAIADGVTPSPSEQPALAVTSASLMRAAAPRARTALDAGVGKHANAESTGTPSEPSTFDEELGLLSTARSGLQTKDIPTCLRAVERYEARFPSGLFAEEMEVIRIDALATSGERARAHALAERFLVVNPRSAYAARVRSLAERTKD